MTAKEIVIKNIEFQCQDRIGFNFLSDKGWRDDIINVDLRTELDIAPKRWQEGDVEYYTDLWGNTLHRMVGKSEKGEIFKPALQNWLALDSYEFPDLGNPRYFKAAHEIAEKEKEKFLLGWLPGWIFSTCRDLRRMDIYFMDLVMEREKIDILHDKFVAMMEKVIDEYGKAGMDAVFFCEDLGIQDRLLIGPAMWSDIFRPIYERLTAKAHQYDMKVVQHSCGYNWELIDDLCDSGIDCLQFDQPGLYDIEALGQKLKSHGVGLYAPCDIQAILPTGDKALIEAHIKSLIKNFKGGLIAKNYPDLLGIGVSEEIDEMAYNIFCEMGM